MGALRAAAVSMAVFLGLVLALPAQAQFTLTVAKSGTGIGKILVSANGSANTLLCAETCAGASASYAPGTSVTLTWSTYGPTTFSRLNSWAGCDSINQVTPAFSKCTVALTGNKTVTATVTQYPYGIYILKSGTGNAAYTISTSTSGGVWTCPTSLNTTWCGYTWPSPFTATLSMAPDSQTAFLGWSGAGCSGNGTCQVSVTGRQLVTASLGGATAPPPVFPITVTSDITPTTANATAAIQFRPQDVGSTANVYVFAVAPSGSLKTAKNGSAGKSVGEPVSWDGLKDAPAGCALAQLDGSGQLVGVGSSQLQAYSSGVLSAQGASVTILNNASTPAVSGATFYVGYGTSSNAMFTGGLYRNAITVPGSSTCPMVSSQTAIWWNPAESGWGINFAHQGNILFGTLFDYDANHQPLWLVMSNGALQPDGVTFEGDLYQASGPAFNANPFTPITAANLNKVGTLSVGFQDANSGSLAYTVNGTQVSKGIQRQVFGSRAAACFPTAGSRSALTNYQDLWWNPDESGWGLNIAHQDDTLFATLFTYDATGKGLWLVMSSGTKQPDGSYAGTLYKTSGPPFDASPFTPIGSADVSAVGTMRLAFTNGTTGTLTYSYNGVQVVKSITRQVFAGPPSACH